MKKIMYSLLLMGATLSFSSCNRTDNLQGTGTDADGNVRQAPVDRPGGASIRDGATGTTGGAGQGNLEGQTAPGGSVVQDDGVQRDVTTGSGLNPARTEADTVPGTGRNGTQTQTGTEGQGPGQRGTAPNTNPTRR
ncbi:hypothetical protein BH24BAC1_BH24BAC1_14100 [soil metagenome]